MALIQTTGEKESSLFNEKKIEFFFGKRGMIKKNGMMQKEKALKHIDK
ncbi:hypothetical protein [Proteus cibi]|nr:hypothetical protein [Proteus cibi]MBS6208816.1 hypothetical protein [Proteus hauseri]